MTAPDHTDAHTDNSTDAHTDDSTDAHTDAQTEQSSAPSNSPTTTAEWISLAISSVLLIGVIALVGRLWASEQQRQPPILQVTQSQIRQSADTFYVPFEVVNTGGKTAASVQVVAELQFNGITIESGEQILNFLSSQEKAAGAFVFSHDPRRGTLVIRIASYQDP